MEQLVNDFIQSQVCMNLDPDAIKGFFFFALLFVEIYNLFYVQKPHGKILSRTLYIELNYNTKYIIQIWNKS